MPLRRALARHGSALIEAVAAVAFAVWTALAIGGADTTQTVDDVATIAAASLATYSCVAAGRRGAKPVRAFWLLLAGAAAAWSLGELVWGYYDLFVGQDPPIPSAADIGYLAAIPLTIAALVVHPGSRGTEQRLRPTLDAAAVATALLFLSWTFVLGATWRYNDVGSLGGVVAVAYPFGDVIIVFLLFRCLRRVVEGRLSLGWVLGGLLAMTISDATYTYLVTYGGFSSGGVIDTGWVIGYAALAVGARYSLQAPPARFEEPRVPSETVQTLVAPYAPLFAALTVIALRVHLGLHIDTVAWALALGLAVLVLARQASIVFARRPGVTDVKAPHQRWRP
jgi:diguanylate cyclase